MAGALVPEPAESADRQQAGDGVIGHRTLRASQVLAVDHQVRRGKLLERDRVTVLLK
jgi:hypothetical protein